MLWSNRKGELGLEEIILTICFPLRLAFFRSCKKCHACSPKLSFIFQSLFLFLLILVPITVSSATYLPFIFATCLFTFHSFKSHLNLLACKYLIKIYESRCFLLSLIIEVLSGCHLIISLLQIVFNNHDHDGQMVVDLDLGAQVLECHGSVMLVSEAHTLKVVKPHACALT